MPCTAGRKRRSADQKTRIASAREYIGRAPTISRNANKENPPKGAPKAQVAIAASQPLQDLKQKLENTQRKVRHLDKKIGALKRGKAEAIVQEKIMKTRLALMERDRNALAQRNLGIQEALKQSEKLCSDLERQLSDELKRHRSELEKYKKRLKRAQKVRDHLAQAKVTTRTPGLSLIHKRTYTETARKMMRMLVQSGCARSKVGKVLDGLAKEMGVKDQKDGKKVRVVSRRTVSRAVLEGYIAAKQQLGYEMKQTSALMISADGTSNRGVNFESMHINMRTPDYSSGSLTVDPQSQPKMRLLCLESVTEQSSEAAIAAFLKRIDEATDYFNRSPYAKALAQKVTIADFLRLLKGMHGDHASKEKSAAWGMAERKQESAINELGEKAILALSVTDLVDYLGAWNKKKLAEAGGIDEWNKLDALEQTRQDKNLMEEIVKTLGRREYDALSGEDRRKLDLFVWAGCCMHKDQNSFKAGNAAMILAWKELGVPPPILLANKANSATLRGILHPEGPDPTATAFSEDEQRAFEQSTRGGCKATALAGTILNNKDDKKGQGDRHIKHFQEKVDPLYTRFPDTSNTRFGSHGEAAADLIQYLDAHIAYINIIRMSKQTATLTNIEYNVLQALNDTATRTELCAMVLYTQAISKPYMNAVRGPKSDNVLDLGPLHELVREHITKLIENPELLISEDLSHVDSTLDGRDWDNPDAIDAVLKLMPTLPHLREITVAFLRGALVTWERFTAEFAPGGLIDEASADEKHLAWMPATNDVNEGALGAYRVTVRGKPSLTLHQYNAMAMFRHNDTQAFMDAVFTPDDHVYVMREARRLDESKLEAHRRKELVDFRVEVAWIRKDKEDARQVKLKADAERLSQIVLVTSAADIDKLTVAKMGEQFDAFRFHGLPDVSPKSRFPRRAERQAELQKILQQYQEYILEHGPLISPLLPSNPTSVAIADDWEAEEEAEMDDL